MSEQNKKITWRLRQSLIKTLQEIEEMYNLIDESREHDFNSIGDKSLPTDWTDEFIKGQNILIQRKKEIAREQMMVVEEKKEIFLEAVQQRKILEKHKEKAKDEAKKLLAKKEAKAMDDIVTSRVGRTGT